MLPSNLLITRKWRDTISPVYANLDKKNLSVAELLIQMYNEHVGKKKGELNEAVEKLENLGYDHRYIRGLATLLDRRCQLEPEAPINPINARREIFKIASQKGYPTTQESRHAILSQAASKLNATVKELEKFLYADLEDEFTLKNFQPINSEALVKQYNLSLTQTLLFHSTELTFTTTGNWQHIFRQIKWLGLIYTIWKDTRGIQIKVDGPASIFQANRRYGTNLAKLLPSIIQNSQWQLSAKILRKGERRLLNLELDSQKHGSYIEAVNKPKEQKIYDSQVEQDFATSFQALDTGWTLTREPEPILAGKYVMIPDFVFLKGGSKVYLEIVGFWTPEYLEEKAKKLNLITGLDMIVAADKDLACRKLERSAKKHKVIYYHRRIPLRPILDHLKAKEEKLAKEQSRLVQIDDLPIQDQVVEVKELAEKLGVLEDAVRKILAAKTFPGYLQFGDLLVKASKMEEMRKKLENRLTKGPLSLHEASIIVEEAGGRRPAQILTALGYKVEWKGIDPQSAQIRREGVIEPDGEIT
ncbi:MAG: DUF790 family protein [Candidatus Bathyarchaeia archaeon]